MGAVGFVGAPFKLRVQLKRILKVDNPTRVLIPRAYLPPSFQSARRENIYVQFSSRASSTCR